MSKPPTYRIVDSAGEKIEVNFYKHELMPVGHDRDVYAVENVLKEENRNGKSFYLSSGEDIPTPKILGFVPTSSLLLKRLYK